MPVPETGHPSHLAVVPSGDGVDYSGVRVLLNVTEPGEVVVQVVQVRQEVQRGHEVHHEVQADPVVDGLLLQVGELWMVFLAAVRLIFRAVVMCATSHVFLRAQA